MSGMFVPVKSSRESKNRALALGAEKIALSHRTINYTISGDFDLAYKRLGVDLLRIATPQCCSRQCRTWLMQNETKSSRRRPAAFGNQGEASRQFQPRDCTNYWPEP